jgi:thiamine-monophosphate kinase
MSSRPGEDELIARFFAPIAGPEGLGLADDAALLDPPAGQEIVLTVDALVAGVHFFADDPPDTIARKALRVNLSDLAAKGARPLGFLLSLALPHDWRVDWLEGFASGLAGDAAAFAFPLMGGDTVSTPGPLTLSVTAVGAAPAGRMARRTGVRPGDQIYVTGTIGDGALGLLVRQGRDLGISPADREFLIERYLVPQPRTGLASAMAAHAHGGMDVSDGFVGDLSKMLRVSGVSARVRLDRLPMSLPARAAIAADPDLFAIAVTGGDDYEVLAAIGPDEAHAFESEARLAHVPATLIGEAVEGDEPPRFLAPDGGLTRFDAGSYSHF